MTIQDSAPSHLGLEAAIESILFASSMPVSIQQLAAALNSETDQIEEMLGNLRAHFQANHGIRLQWHANRVQFTTAPEFSGVVEKFLGLESTSRLSRAALEVLAIIAYKQPITRPGIDAVRGVNSDGVLKNLLSKGLVEEGGRAEGPGRPILYNTTADFLQNFGLSSLDEMPLLDEEEPQVSSNLILKD